MSNRRERRNNQKNVQKKKPRLVGLQFSLDNIPKEDLKGLKFGIKYTGQGLEVVVKTDNRIIHTDLVKGYQRENKEGFNLKITNFFSGTSQMGVHPNLQEFGTLVAIDTNSIKIHNTSIHIGAAAGIYTTIQDGEFITKVQIINIFPVQGEIEKPENHNWRNFITYIKQHPNYIADKKVGLIVDSDLGNIPDYNAGNKPIIEDFYLPSNFTLIYASADAANDELTNQAVAFCDKVAALALAEIKEEMENNAKTSQ